MNKLRTLTETEKIELKHIRIKRIIFFTLFLFWFPIMLELTSLIKSEKVTGLIALSYLILLFFLGFSFQFSKCPLCGGYLFFGLISNPFRGKCPSCGLRMKEENIKENWNEMRPKWEGEETNEEEK